MKRLGHGLQYTVYDAGARVYKRPATRAEMRWRTLRQNPRLLWQPAAWTANVDRMVKQRRDVIATLQQRDIDRSLFGNVVFEGEAMWQDRLKPLGHALTSEAAGRQLIDQFAAFTKACWQHGLAETTFNFTVNHGVDAQGSIVILDVGEVTFDRAELLDDISTKLWTRAWSYTTDLSAELREYYFATMEPIMNEAMVRACWPGTRDVGRHRLEPVERAPIPATHVPAAIRTPASLRDV